MAEKKNEVGGVISAPVTYPVTYEKHMSSKGKVYDVIKVDLGYRQVSLTFDRYAISEILGVSLSELYSYPLDTVRLIGEIGVSDEA